MSTDKDMPGTSLFVVHVGGEAGPLDTGKMGDAIQLDDGLYLVRTGATQSRLYHAVKRQAQPDTLFVGRLADDPKFKGMESGALKWVRARA